MHAATRVSEEHKTCGDKRCMQERWTRRIYEWMAIKHVHYERQDEAARREVESRDIKAEEIEEKE